MATILESTENISIITQHWSRKQAGATVCKKKKKKLSLYAMESHERVVI